RDRRRRRDRLPVSADAGSVRRRHRAPLRRPRPGAPPGPGRARPRRPLLAPGLRRRARGRPPRRRGCMMPPVLDKLRFILTPAQKRRWIALAPLLVLTGTVETLATGLVYGLIKIAGDPSYAMRIGPLAAVLDFIGAHTDREIVLAYGLVLIVFF